MTVQHQQQCKSLPGSTVFSRGFTNRRYSKQSRRKLSYRQGKVYDTSTPVISEQINSNQQQSPILNFLKHRNYLFTPSSQQVEQETEKKVFWKHRRISSSLSFEKKFHNQKSYWKHSASFTIPRKMTSYQKFTTRIRPMVESMQSLSKRREDEHKQENYRSTEAPILLPKHRKDEDTLENYRSTEASILLSEEYSLLEEIERLKKINLSPLPQQNLNLIPIIDSRKKKESLEKETNQSTLEENCSQKWMDNKNQSEKEKENNLLPKSMDNNIQEESESHRRQSMESTESQDSFYTAVSTSTIKLSQSLKKHLKSNTVKQESETCQDS
ncbi:hypothetical protein INT45_004163 [Circinella minor]|uniref:Uncharacterized protein n=1 Tax=Circinella minor TaxID=1195481 RepID=A0A8H7S2H9_9FUNG|nr:hypothetical protein INT45_004163 [Circinella minor]